MSKEKVEVLVEGGKAVAGAQMGQALGPLGININQILQDINKKTEAFKSMKVPVKIIADTETKKYTIEIGTPPVAELIKRELGIQKASSQPNKQKVGNLAIEQVIKIAKMKKDSMFARTLKASAKCVVGSCNALGVLVEGKTAPEINKDIDKGLYDNEIKQEKTEVSAEKMKRLKEDLNRIQAELEKQQEKLAALKVEEKPTAAAKEEVKEEKPSEEKKEKKPSEEKKEKKGKK